MLFEFVSHEEFPEDDFIKEVVYFTITSSPYQHRVGYVRKIFPTGGMRWDVISASAKKNGKRATLEGYINDSSFVHKDILKFLENRSWEPMTRSYAKQISVNPSNSFHQTQEKDDSDEKIPF